MKKIIKIIIILFSFCFGFSSSSYALEVVSFKASIGLFRVTVALDDLENTKKVSCIIYSNEKPIAKGIKRINGVGTIVIINDPQITQGLTVKCK